MTIERIGQRVGNHRTLQLLGEGKLAAVYLGEHVTNKSLAAIKIFRMRLTKNDVQSFLVDTQFIANLHDSHIIPLFDFGVESEHPYITMSFAPGGTLRQYYSTGSLLSLDTLIHNVNQLADALAHAHSVNLVHCDIKPENILVGQQPNQLLLTDFRIATLAQIVSLERAIGTVAYMAPEQLEDKPIPASDQYALGIVVYEWLTGSPPFTGSFSEIIRQHKSMVPPSLQSRVAGISNELEEVVLRALAKKPEERFNSVQDFARTLERVYLMGQSTMTLYALRSSKQSLKMAGNVIEFSSRNDVNAHLASEQIQTPNNRIPRRTVLAGLLGLTGVAIAEAEAAGPTLQKLFPEPAPIPGSTLFTYRGHSSDVLAVVWSPNDQYVASAGADKTVQIWEMNIDHPNLTYHGHRDVVRTIAWSPDGKYIASGGADKTVQIWLAASTGNVLTYDKHSDEVNTVAWSPDGKYIASGGADHMVRIWLTADGSDDTIYLHDGAVNAIDWSPDGRYIASASNDGTVHIWDIYKRQVVFVKDHTNRVLSVAWWSNNNFLASGGDDKEVHVWQFKQPKRLLTYSGHSGRVNAIRWPAEDEQVISASADTTVQVWNPTSGLLLLTYHGHVAEVFTIAKAHHGKKIASGSRDTTVQVWKAGL